MTKEENEKLNLLLSQFAQLNATFTEKMSRLDEVTDEVKELNRTLRGHNGTPGLLTQFELAKAQLSTVTALTEKINTSGCIMRQKEISSDDKNLTSKIEEQTPTYKFLREKFAVPITVAFIVGLINLVVIAKFILPLFSK